MSLLERAVEMLLSECFYADTPVRILLIVHPVPAVSRLSFAVHLPCRST